MKQVFSILFSILMIQGFSQVPVENKPTSYPVVYIDNVKSDVKQMHKIDPNDIIEVNTLRGQEAIDKIGPEGKYGVIYVQTKKYVRNNYWKYLSSKSPEFAKAITAPSDLNGIQYVLNGRIVTDNIDKTIAALNDKNFRSLVLIDQEELIKEYRVKDKKYGVIILSDPRVKN